MDCDLTLLKRSPKLSREVRASSGMVIRAILDCGYGKNFVLVDGKRRLGFWKVESVEGFGRGCVSVKGRSATEPVYLHIPQADIKHPGQRLTVKWDVEATVVLNTCSRRVMFLQEILVPERECEKMTKEAKLSLTVDLGNIFGRIVAGGSESTSGLESQLHALSRALWSSTATSLPHSSGARVQRNQEAVVIFGR
jgi:hypothetical protein